MSATHHATQESTMLGILAGMKFAAVIAFAIQQIRSVRS
jgi:hypothetical protein